MGDVKPRLDAATSGENAMASAMAQDVKPNMPSPYALPGAAVANAGSAIASNQPMTEAGT
jgi:hypothetical protein